MLFSSSFFYNIIIHFLFCSLCYVHVLITWNVANKKRHRTRNTNNIREKEKYVSLAFSSSSSSFSWKKIKNNRNNALKRKFIMKCIYFVVCIQTKCMIIRSNSSKNIKITEEKALNLLKLKEKKWNIYIEIAKWKTISSSEYQILIIIKMKFFQMIDIFDDSHTYK